MWTILNLNEGKPSTFRHFHLNDFHFEYFVSAWDATVQIIYFYFRTSMQAIRRLFVTYFCFGTVEISEYVEGTLFNVYSLNIFPVLYVDIVCRFYFDGIFLIYQASL